MEDQGHQVVLVPLEHPGQPETPVLMLHQLLQLKGVRSVQLEQLVLREGLDSQVCLDREVLLVPPVHKDNLD